MKAGGRVAIRHTRRDSGNAARRRLEGRKAVVW